MNRTFETFIKHGKRYNMLGLPGTNFFKIEIVNTMGSHVERIYKERTGKNVFGISHFIEHLAFRNTKDYTSADLLKMLKNEGSYNASTDYDRINYYFQTTMDRIHLGVNLVCNYTYNTLEKISLDEFEIEKKVVYNEAKRYADDDQTMFYFNITAALNGYDPEDNVIGIPETIDTFTLEDAIAIKDIFLRDGNEIVNISYDSNVLTANEVIDIVEAEMSRFKPLDLENRIVVTPYDYGQSLGTVKPGNFEIPNESAQAMTALVLDVVDAEKILVQTMANIYLSSYAADTSLNDIIREKHGLTYSVNFYTDRIGYKPFVLFSADVTRGNEQLLLELFKESINASVDAWGEEAHKRLMNANSLKRTMSLLDQKGYGYWHGLATWYPEVIDGLSEVLKVDVDAAYQKVDAEINTVEAIGAVLEKIRNCVNSGEYSVVRDVQIQ